MTQQLEFNHSFIAFGQQFSFLNNETMLEASHLASDCETNREFKSMLNAEEVFYKVESCKFVSP